MKTKIETRHFENVHGKRPSGLGHWMFIPSSKVSAQDYLDFIFTVPGVKTLAEAKKVAVAHFTAKGVLYASVCS